MRFTLHANGIRLKIIPTSRQFIDQEIAPLRDDSNFRLASLVVRATMALTILYFALNHFI